MNVTFYNFSKRVNSTARPSGGVSVDCYLKSPCSTTHPTLQLQFTGGTDPASWNMCYIATFNRYYYISEWVYNESVWEAHCDVDALASWKDDIGRQSCYVLRSSADYDGNIIDTLYPCKAQANHYITETKATGDDLTFAGLSDGWFVIGVNNGEYQFATGVISYYAMSYSDFMDFAQSLWTETIVDFVYNPLDYISTIKFFPQEISHQVTKSPFKLGKWGDSHEAYGVSPASYLTTHTASYVLPAHPYASDRGSYLNFPPYTERFIEYYPYGVFRITEEPIYQIRTLSIERKTDTATGKSLLCLKTAPSGAVLQRCEAMVGVDIAVGHNQLNFIPPVVSIASTAVQGYYSLADNNAFTNYMIGRANAHGNKLMEDYAIERGDIQDQKIMHGTAAGIATSLTQMRNSAEVRGHQGCFAAIGEKPTIVSYFKIPTDESNDEYGRPLCVTKTLSTIPGYIKCANSDISISATQEELLIIKQNLDTGFFYE